MSTLENDAIYEAAYEDFYDLYFTSDSFRAIVDELINKTWDEWTKGETALKACFEALWKNDCELLVRDKRTAVKALIMFHKSMSVFK
jgi:hypothetical protein